MRVIVLGAGLLGCATALQLRRRGVDVTVLDQAPGPMQRASLVNEGKIHLGFVYGHDATMATAEVMLDGAVHFAPVLRTLLGHRFDNLEVARPFTYLVAQDTMVPADDLLAHYCAVEERLRARLDEDAALDYLGRRDPEPLRPLTPDELRRLVPSGRAVLAVRTPERSISTWELAPLVVEAVAEDPQVRVESGVRVDSVARSASGFVVTGRRGDDAVEVHGDQVVNCLWSGRLAIDATIGVTPPRSWAYRLKYRVLFRPTAAHRSQPSLTIALGAYGDVVLHERGEIGYASWYPACLQGWSDELEPPSAWEAAAARTHDDVDHAVLAARTLEALDEWCPGLAGAEVLDVAAGTIMAWGETDIVDHASRLHRRDELGVWSYDGYHTVETGKYTMAPLIATRAADAVTGRAPRAVA